MGMHIYIKVAPFASAPQIMDGREGSGDRQAAPEAGAESFELRLYPVFNKLSSSARPGRAKLCRYLSNFIAAG